MLFTYDNKPFPIENFYKGQSCFLVLSGPSLHNYDLSKLNLPGVMTMGVNNSPSVFRPNMWVMGDDVHNFMASIYKDPRILKFIPRGKREHTLFDNNTWEETNIKVKACPATLYFDRNEKFNAETFLTENTVNWGNHSDNGGGRSVMLLAIRILHLLGFKNVFLLGADFRMNTDNKYAFEQDRSSGSIRCNNSTYRKLDERFELLKPIFEKADFHVYNCYAQSGLKAFKHISFEAAIRIARNGMPESDRTAGLYDRKAKLRDTERRKTDGIIYYNAGKGCLARLVVSVSTLRRVTDWPTTILCDKDSYADCLKIGERFKVDVKIADMPVDSRNIALVNRCLLHKYTPYKLNICLDADTIVLKDAFLKLHKYADKNEFAIAQFADWKASNGIIADRIKKWEGIIDIEKALEYPFAINCGVFAFRTDSKLMNDWHALAVKNLDTFIPDEVACQIMLPDYPHVILDSSYNVSCKYGRITKLSKVIHFHGKKHCRIEDGKYRFMADRWFVEYDKISDFVSEWVQYDKMLVENLGRRNAETAYKSAA